MIIFKQSCSLLHIGADLLHQLHLHVLMAHNQVLSWQYVHLWKCSMCHDAVFFGSLRTYYML